MLNFSQNSPLRKPALWFVVVVLIGIGALISWGIIPPPGTTGPFPERAQPIVQEYRSEDGRVVCYSNQVPWNSYWRSSAISCLPAWLLDRPSNWVIAYPKEKQK